MMFVSISLHLADNNLSHDVTYCFASYDFFRKGNMQSITMIKVNISIDLNIYIDHFSYIAN